MTQIKIMFSLNVKFGFNITWYGDGTDPLITDDIKNKILPHKTNEW